MDVLTSLNTALAGRYEILRQIGSGGMAVVYLARDARHARNVALKVLNPELGAVLGPERFLSEIRVTANLQHPNLLPLFDSGEALGLLFYVMPFIEGESLRARLDREKQLPVNEAIRVAVAIASALDYAHRHGVIHRDLKPENILLHEGQPLVADFGIALAVSNAGGSRITQTGLSLGTPQYMSPEQATGDRAIDGRTDIYSLAAVLYEMLAGDPPHTGSTAQAVVARVLTEKPRGVRASRDTVPTYVESAIDRALAKIPADRWATAQEFADALGGAGPEVAERAPRSRVTPRRAASVAAGVAIGAVAATAIFAAVMRPRSAPPSSGIARFPLTLGNDIVIPFDRAISHLAVSPDGRDIAAIASGRGASHQVVVRALSDPRPRPIAGTENASQPVFSPDGKWICFVSGRQLKKVPLEGGTPVVLAEVGSGGGYGIAWLTNEQIVMEFNDRLAIVSAGGGVPRLMTQLDTTRRETSQRWPVALADGNTVLYSFWRGSLATGRIGIATLSDGKSEPLPIEGVAPLGFLDGKLVYVNLAGTIMAVPFDLRRRRPTGERVVLSDQVVVGPIGAASAALSANGTLVYESGSSSRMVVLSDDKGNEQPIIPVARTYTYPRLSPDGKRIAVTVYAAGRSDIWIHTITDGAFTRLTTDGTLNERPEWTADGRSVIYRSDVGGSTLRQRPVDGSGPETNLLALPGVEVWEGVPTGDGQSLVYRVRATVAADIYSRPLSGADTTPRPLAVSSFSEWTPRGSPDGKWVAYAADESGTYQVYVRPISGLGARYQVSIDGGTMPVWSRDGRRLFYTMDQQLLRADLSFTPAFSVTRRAKVLEGDFSSLNPGHAGYDVTPDGKFLLLKPVENDLRTIVAVNWVDELRKVKP